MKALTIWQPWASLIMGGAKPWEWRKWPAPRPLRGERIVIHAGARRARQDEILNILDDIMLGDSSLIEEIAEPMLRDAHLGSWPLACGLGTAVIGEPIPALAWAEKHMKPGYDSSRIDHHQWAWPLTSINSWIEPVPVRGLQGFWTWPWPI
jgi:hypothetical protein